VPAVQGLLERHGVKPAELTGLAVGTGPGSYTGLRIGLMLAKTLGYATGCKVVAVPTFSILAAMVKDVGEVDVIADALKQTVYVQRFGPADPDGLRRPLDGLRAEKLADWLSTLRVGGAVTGPGLELHGGALPAFVRSVPVVSGAVLASLLKLVPHFPVLAQGELFSLEPLYVRGSSAEEKAKETELQVSELQVSKPNSET
jgi:tRNA threonylcarbamoyladenosine biosynthesis protein TsaB